MARVSSLSSENGINLLLYVCLQLLDFVHNCNGIVLSHALSSLSKICHDMNCNPNN